MKTPLLTLYLFNLLVGDFILFVALGKKDTQLDAAIMLASFSIASVILLSIMIRVSRKYINYFILLFLTLFVSFLIPIAGSIIYGTALSIMKSNFHFDAGILLFAIAISAGSTFFWPIMGVINFAILVWFKRRLNENALRVNGGGGVIL